MCMMFQMNWKIQSSGALEDGEDDDDDEGFFSARHPLSFPTLLLSPALRPLSTERK